MNSTAPIFKPAGASSMKKTGSQFLMWVDGVGGFLVCLDDTVSLGQATYDSNATIGILGDLSRNHAVIRRERDAYTVIPHADTWLDGQKIERPFSLNNGDELRLGRQVSFRFRQPHPLSTSARMESISHHRTQPAADGIVLMASSCILGPSLQNHVFCRFWSEDVMLVRKGETLCCFSKQSFEVDGKECQGRANISMNSRICGADFCISLEPID